jgi:hypothetical protein
MSEIRWRFFQALAYQRWLAEWCAAWNRIAWIAVADSMRGKP